jgi:hypothetical protein
VFPNSAILLPSISSIPGSLGKLHDPLSHPSKMATANGVSKSQVEIIDIQCEELDESLLKLMLECLDPEKSEPRTFPTLILYDGRSRRVAHPKLYL